MLYFTDMFRKNYIEFSLNWVRLLPAVFSKLGKNKEPADFFIANFKSTIRDIVEVTSEENERVKLKRLMAVTSFTDTDKLYDYCNRVKKFEFESLIQELEIARYF